MLKKDNDDVKGEQVCSPYIVYGKIKMREKIYKIIDVNSTDSIYSKMYNVFMMVCIVLSLVPLAIKNPSAIWTVIDKVTVSVFIVDYILRFFISDLLLQKGKKSFFLYPFTPMAIIDLLSILPSFVAINGAFKVLRSLRLARTFRVFRTLKVLRFSKNIVLVVTVLKRKAKPLLAVLGVAMFYIVVCALIMINVEPETFDNFFEAIYWAMISLTSVGYGDICPITNVGRAFTMISAFMGVAIIAMPSGIITAGFLEEIDVDTKNRNTTDNKLSEIKNLYENQLITKEDYEKSKQQILQNIINE